MHRIALPAAVVLAGTVLAAAPARADDSRLELSADGVHFVDTLQRPLFDPTVRWVPGDVRVARFYVRNASSDAGDLTVRVSDGRPGELVTSDALVVDARAADGPWTVVESGAIRDLLDLDDVSGDTVVPVDVRVRMRALAPNATMVLDSALRLTVTLTDADAISDAGSDGEGGPGDGTGSGETGGRPGDGIELPGTGATIPRGLGWLGIVLCGVGGFLLARTRQRRTAVSHG